MLEGADYRVLRGDCREVLRTLPDSSVQTCVTSPPYYGLRDYGIDGQIGLEQSPDEYIAQMTQVFREVRRVLRDDGTLWLNLGDSYSAGGRGGGAEGSLQSGNKGSTTGAVFAPWKVQGYKEKNLLGIPWRVAFALQADGWYLRQDIIWHKPNPMPESVTDRCTKAHEYIFLLSKSARYHYDHEAIAEEAVTPIDGRGSTEERKSLGHPSRYGDSEGMAARGEGWSMPSISARPSGRNKRSVWTVCTRPFADAHFATFPPDLIEPCILAGAPKGATVLDPFNGSGTTGQVALAHHRQYIGIELNPVYIDITRKRLDRVLSPLFDGIDF